MVSTSQRPGTLTDIKVLLDFLKVREVDAECSEAQITSLQALSSMCTREVAELICQCGGLKLIWKLCGSTKSPGVSQACLHALACAVESSVRVKLFLSTKGVFKSLEGILSSSNISEKTKLCAVYFLITLVSECESAQELVRSSGCLQILLRFLVSGIQLITRNELSPAKRKKEVWMLSSKALRLSVALPPNKTNQLECIKFIPHMVTILHESKGDEKIVLHACQVLGAVMEKNNFCQMKAFDSRALEVLILTLQSHSACSENGEVLGEVVVALHNLLGDKNEYSERFEKLGGIAVLLGLIDSDKSKCQISVHHINHILTILMRCASYSERSRQYLIKGDAASAVVRLMNSVQGNDYFNKISAIILKHCMGEPKDEVKKSGSEGGENDDSNRKSTDSSSDGSSANTDGSDVQSPSRKSEQKMLENFGEMINGGGSCISEILERQQTQIDLLQKLLLVERERRIGNEKTLVETAKGTAMSATESSIFSPQMSECRSCRTPVIRQCARREWSNTNARGVRTASSQGTEFPFLPFGVPLSQTVLHSNQFLASSVETTPSPNILTSTALPTPEANTERFLSPNLDHKTRQTQTNTQRRTRSYGCQTEAANVTQQNIIDVESYTPKRVSKPLQRTRHRSSSSRNESSTPRQNVVKYYVKDKKKIRQHFAPTGTSNTSGNCSTDVLRGECLVSVKNAVPEDDVISVCSEIILDEIQKERKRKKQAPLSFSPIAKNTSLRALRSKKTKKLEDEDCDVYSYQKPSPASMKFKKPCLLPPRFSRALRSHRIKFDVTEEKNLTHGVNTLGQNFKEILYTYKFHPSRTAMDLRDKYRNMCRKRGTEFA